MKIFDKFIKENVRPTNISGVGIFKADGTKVGTIPCSNITYDGSYSFGLLSDVHVRRDSAKDSKYGSNEDFRRALSYFNNDRSNVKFTCICGDITYDASETELGIYKTAIDNKAGSKPVYTCGGNHDRWVDSSWNAVHWNQSGATGANNPTTWNTYTKMGTDKHKVITYNNDVFIFFSMDSMDGDTDGASSSGMSDPYIASDVTWLRNQLEAHKSERVFIFLHCFFPDCCGNYGNIYQRTQGAKINENRDNWRALRALRETYYNTVWFSGHSHWIWEMQGVTDGNGENGKGRNLDANIFPCDGATRTGGWCVHVPSCSEPAITKDGKTMTTEDQADKRSQIGIVDVYADFILIRGLNVDAQMSSFNYVPIAQYKLDTTLK